MRRLSLFFPLLIAFVLAGCSGHSASSAAAETAEVDSAAENATAQQAATVPDFKTFWRAFVQQANDKTYLSGQIAFPFPYASFQNFLVSADEFRDEDMGIHVFESLSERTDLVIGHLTEGYLNGYLRDDFTKKFGNLDQIYVVESKPEPTGYLAYFRWNGQAYQFIGCVLLEIAD